MHTAYNVHSILKQGVQIESIAAYDNHVILGTRSGQLIMYYVDVEEKAGVDMRMFNKNFSKKPITQMEVIPDEKLLFVLTDQMIHVCDISRIEGNFSFIHSSMDTKGCSLFTMDVKTAKSTTGETATVIRLCCALKRRLQFFYWKMNEHKLKSLEFSIELKDVPKSLCWIDQVVAVGYKDEYVIYDILSQKLEKLDLFVTSPAYSLEPCICLIRSNMLGVSKDDYLVVTDPSQYIKAKEIKQVGAEVIGVGNKNSPKPLRWSSPLLGLVWDEPFAVGRVASAIEVRSLVEKDTLVQSIPELQKTKFLVRSSKGTIFAAATSELWCIRMVDIPTQRQQLLQQKKFQLAVELTQISNEGVELIEQTVREIHVLHAKELFSSKQYSEAMKEFELAAIDPYDVIRLFPSLVPDQKATQGEVSAVMPTVPYLEDDLEIAYMALIEFLASARQREVVKLPKGSSKSLLEIIDTTLLKCYLQTNDSLVAPLLRLNQCHLKESEKTLKKYDKLSELIILYQMNGKHKKALELLKSQAGIEGSVLQGRQRTIRYLQELGPDHLQLIFEFSDWVLTEEPQEGLCIFTDALIEVESLPRANVLDFLLSKHRGLVIPYLEHIIHELNDDNTIRHNVLIQQYREQVQRLLELKSRGIPTPELEPLRAKLYEMLKNSEHYSPDRVLESFPTTVLLEERALILGRLKKHEKVLSIYIQVLGDLLKAREYCEANYENDKEIFHTLLRIILSPLPQPPYEGVVLHPDFIRPNRVVALDLLNTYATKLNPTKIFQYLPDDLPMSLLQNYLEKVIRKQLAEQHQQQMMRGLLEAELKRLQAAVGVEKQKSFELTEKNVCPECHKRFGSQSAFVRYPNGQVVHLSCHDRIVKAAGH